MSERSKSCPNCLSTILIETKPHEFQCRSCGNQFSFNKPTESITTEDVRGRYCPFCGTSTTGGLGHKCTGCNRVDFCNNCVHRSPTKLYCNDCLKKEKRNCLDCGTYAEYYCQSCENISKQIQNENFQVIRSCKAHQNVFYQHTEVDRNSNRLIATFCNCPNCGGICPNCTMRESGFLKSKLVCKFCKANLREVKRWVD